MLPRFVQRTILLLLATGFVALPACRPYQLRSAAPRPSVLLLTIDSLRPDHLATYGYARDTSPHLTALARDGVLFLNAFTAGPWTSPGLVSLFTAQIPDHHGVVARDRSASPQLPSALRAFVRGGYRVPDLFGFQGAGNYQNLGFESWDGEVVPAASLPTWLLENSREPVFLASHLRSVHLPYNPPPPHDRFFLEAVAASQRPVSAAVQAVRSNLRVFKGAVVFEDQDRPIVEALYDGAVEAQDVELGRILSGLRDSGMYDRLFIVVTADHGEELLDHGFVGHPSTNLDGHLHDEVLRVPLVIKFPRQRYAGTRIDTMVRSIDVLPTLLDAIGLPGDPALDGRSLLPIVRSGGGSSPGPVIAATNPCGWACPEGRFDRYLRAVRTERYKLVEERSGGNVTYRLYDLARDPHERQDVSAVEPKIVESLRARLSPLPNGAMP